MPNVEHSFVLYALLLEPGGCLRAHITLFELVEPEKKKAIIVAIVVPADWMFAESLERLQISRNPRNIRWAEGDIICRAAKRKDMWEWKELECFGLAVLSLTNLLRIGEAWTDSSPGDRKLCFTGEKSRSGEHYQVWTRRPQKEKDPISRATRGRVDVNGRIPAAWRRSRIWERS